MRKGGCVDNPRPWVGEEVQHDAQLDDSSHRHRPQRTGDVGRLRKQQIQGAERGWKGRREGGQKSVAPCQGDASQNPGKPERHDERRGDEEQRLRDLWRGLHKLGDETWSHRGNDQQRDAQSKDARR